MRQSASSWFRKILYVFLFYGVNLPNSLVLVVQGRLSSLSSTVTAIETEPRRNVRMTISVSHYTTADMMSESGSQIVSTNNDARLAEDHSTTSQVTHLLASLGILSDLKSYLRTKPNLIYARDKDGWTILHEAVAYNQMNVVEYLVEEQDAELNAVTYRGSSALYLAEERHGVDSPMATFLTSIGAIRIEPNALLRGNLSNDVERHGDL